MNRESENFFEGRQNNNDINVPRILVSADRSSSGKTTIMMGLLSALVSRGYTVQPYKVGLDYIDPSYHSEITGRKARNLDGYLMQNEDVVDCFVHGYETNETADIALIEGVRGLYEGLESLTDTGSTAQIAKILDCPVILIINARSITRSAAALVKGFDSFDNQVNIAGIILNNVGSEKHAKKAKDAIEYYTKLPVIGIVPRKSDMQISMRHLGLIPALESRVKVAEYESKISDIENIISTSIDIDRIIEIASNTKSLSRPNNTNFQISDDNNNEKVVIGIALDEAFNFYYHDNIELLRLAGAEIKYFSPLHDKKIPKLDGIYIGGGYPELFGEKLEQNESLKNKIYDLSLNGTPIYAECGGLMYLTEQITTASMNPQNNSHGISYMENGSYEMIGALPGQTIMNDKRVVSYNTGIIDIDNVIGTVGNVFKGHEFHHSEIVGLPQNVEFTIKLTRGEGIMDGKDGLIVNNTVGSYAHLHAVSYKEFASSFVSFVTKNTIK
ncbi:Ni-sirohydrochlorin a,c-diamide synthase [Methanosalsum natronophilum]|uniref:Cobyrinate a,c-diamide synthase n=1 Tax=Methanosalsum natronophilum TaxID=768733 RepID=A0A3R7XCW4_9EURY|nr:Ni-sirohydrochlorin a,c-diamide synthase [Methanosalsum natronophilum]MCS3923059.1 cobyrinic acid a,c-diamide synthase [Methanosalsum natronophilum]RQD79898.1 MAG: Ni-sirohydrochlorin a,c-diamide synthase [Methanosalsum natronophilum]